MAETHCPKCGKKLESSDADCPACLLNLALEISPDKTGASPGKRVLSAQKKRSKPEDLEG